MNKQDAHVGMVVVFGRDNELTRGNIMKLNPTRARVESLEQRGNQPSGSRFNVPYFLLRPAEDDQAPATRTSGSQSS